MGVSQSDDYALVGAVASEIEKNGETGSDTVPREVARRRLNRLSDAEREVYESVEFEGLRPADLAPYTDWSESTIRTLLSRARQKVGELES